MLGMGFKLFQSLTKQKDETIEVQLREAEDLGVPFIVHNAFKNWVPKSVFTGRGRNKDEKTVSSSAERSEG